MAVAVIESFPPAPQSSLGPYRRGDYEALADEPRCELIYGRLYLSPSPSLAHQAVVVALLSRLDDLAQRSGGRVYPAPLDVHLADHSVVQPDLVYISAERLEMLSNRVEGVPDLLIEILSPGTARRDRGEKLRLYAEAGVREFWIVDPIERQIEFLVNDGGRFAVSVPLDDRYESSALPGVALDLGTLWRDVERRLP